MKKLFLLIVLISGFGFCLLMFLPGSSNAQLNKKECHWDSETCCFDYGGITQCYICEGCNGEIPDN